MKNYFRFSMIFVIFLILGGTISAYGQNNSGFLLDSTASSMTCSWIRGGLSSLGRCKYFYSTKNRIIQKRLWSNPPNNKPSNYYYSYDNGKLTSIEIILKNEVLMKTTINHNDKGLTTDSIIQSNHQGVPLKNNCKFIYDYNIDNLKSSESKYNWYKEKWYPSQRISYEYDKQKRKAVEIFEGGDSTGFYLSHKTIYLYDLNDNLIEKQEYNYTNGSWSASNTTLYTYINGLLNARLYYYEIQSPHKLAKIDSLFYNEGRLVLEKFFYLDGETLYFVGKIERFYDKNNLLIEFINTTVCIEGPYTQTTLYFYIPKYTSLVDILDVDLSISPNPASDEITVSLKPSEGFEPSEGSEIHIYNFLGEKVLSVGAENFLPLHINISDLTKGMYFVRIGNNAAKFVKM